jgi:hypothetical protein
MYPLLIEMDTNKMIKVTKFIWVVMMQWMNPYTQNSSIHFKKDNAWILSIQLEVYSITPLWFWIFCDLPLYQETWRLI